MTIELTPAEQYFNDIAFVSRYFHLLRKHDRKIIADIIASETGLKASLFISRYVLLSHVHMMKPKIMRYLAIEIENRATKFRNACLMRLNEYIVHYSDRSVRDKYIAVTIKAFDKYEVPAA